MSRGLSARAYYMPYVHIWSLANVYIGHIYMFSMFICLCLCILHAEYMQMGANWCKCMLCLHIITLSVVHYTYQETFIIL